MKLQMPGEVQQQCHLTCLQTAMPQLFVHASGDAALPTDFRESSTNFKSGQEESLRSVLFDAGEEKFSSVLFTHTRWNYGRVIPHK